MPLWFKIQRYALVCPGKCGKTKANQFKKAHRRWRKRTRTGMWKRTTDTLAFPGNDKVKFKWPNFHVLQFFVWLHPRFSLWTFLISLQVKKKKTKTWPHEDCYEETVFANSRRNHICSEELEDHILLPSKRTWGPVCNFKNTGWEAVPSLVQSHKTSLTSSTILTFPRKTNTSGKKTPREGGFE